MRRYEAIRLGVVAGKAVPIRLERSKGITRVGPVWCSIAGNTSTGMAGTRGLAADVYSKSGRFPPRSGGQRRMKTRGSCAGSLAERCAMCQEPDMRAGAIRVRWHPPCAEAGMKTFRWLLRLLILGSIAWGRSPRRMCPSGAPVPPLRASRLRGRCGWRVTLAGRVRPKVSNSIFTRRCWC